jgi:hypothetical protein
MLPKGIGQQASINITRAAIIECHLCTMLVPHPKLYDDMHCLLSDKKQ